MKHSPLTISAIAAALLLCAPGAHADALEDREAARQATAARVAAGASCKGCDLFQTDLSYQEAAGIDLSKSRLRQANMSLSTFDRVNFAGADMSVLEGFGARFERSVFTNVNFTNASLVGAWFGRASLAGANLSGANLSGAYLATATGLTRGQLSSACGDADTRLPPGLTIPMCSAAGPAAPVPALPVEEAPAVEVALPAPAPAAAPAIAATPVPTPPAPAAPPRATPQAPTPVAAPLPPAAPASFDAPSPAPAAIDLPTLPRTDTPAATPSAPAPATEPSRPTAEPPVLRGTLDEDAELLGGLNTP